MLYPIELRVRAAAILDAMLTIAPTRFELAPLLQFFLKTFAQFRATCRLAGQTIWSEQ